MKKNKFLITGLTLVSTTTIAAGTIISCGKNEQNTRHFDILPTYTGQADQLLALGINADYYPLQLNTKYPFEYITNPEKFMTNQTDDFKNKFKNKIKELTPKIKGVSWWNQDAKNSDDSRVDNSYWQEQEGSILLYEHYLLDDDVKVINKSWAPKHHNKSSIQTNFRASRDPYTRMPKGVFYGWDLSNFTLDKIKKGINIVASDIFEQPLDNKQLTDINAKGNLIQANEFSITNGKLSIILNGDSTEINAKAADLIILLRNKRKEFLDTAADNNGNFNADWFYNDWYFADFYHRMFLDNKDFQTSAFKKWVIDSTKESPFTTKIDRTNNTNIDDAIKSLFEASTFRKEEVKMGMKNATSSPLPHHPIYEQQEGEIGAAPMFEGAMRDNQLYLFNVAWQISNLVNWGTPYGEEFYNLLPQKANSKSKDKMVANSKEEANAVKAWIVKTLPQKKVHEMKAAFQNANKITNELKNRMTNIKDYFHDLGVNGKTFGMLTIAPGKGMSTIQTMSKYSFLYKELGFAQPIPNNINDLKQGADKFNAAWNQNGTNSYLNDGKIQTNDQEINVAVGANSIFNMDDNGWFWTLGEAGKLEGNKLEKFKGSFDMGIISSRDANFEAEIKNNSGIKAKMLDLFKNKTNLNIESKNLKKGGIRANYDLWNEGLKTPFVIHMMLDQIIDVAEHYALTTGGKNQSDIDAMKTKRDKAINWGNYFTKDFLK